MDRYLEYLNSVEILVGITILSVLIFIYLIINFMKHRKYRRRLEGLEIKATQLKSTPVSFKLNKIIALGKVNNEVKKLTGECQEKFDKTQTLISDIYDCISNADDLLYLRKYRDLKNLLKQIDSDILICEQELNELVVFLDGILEKESEQRTEITKLKDIFRECNQKIKNSSLINEYCHNSIDEFIAKIENDFSQFEENMFASNFEEAALISEGIEKDLEALKVISTKFDKYLELIFGILPLKLEKLVALKNSLIEKGVVLSHLEVNTNLDIINNTINKTKENLCHLKIEDNEETINDLATRIEQLSLQFEREEKAFDQFNETFTQILNVINNLKNDYHNNNKLIEEMRVKYQIFDLESSCENLQPAFSSIDNIIETYENTLPTKTIPYTTQVSILKELTQLVKDAQLKVNKTKNKLNDITKDEKRAHEQVLKMKLVIKEIERRLHYKHLPTIGISFHNAMNESIASIKKVEDQLNEVPMDIDVINTILENAIDIVYKLFDNVNNLIGVSEMAENAIVFGNKYRSTFEEVDNQLTRAELFFRNGEYTQALSIAIKVIEKINPGSYEKLIKSKEMKTVN